MSLAIIENSNYKIDYVMNEGQMWFRAKDIAKILEYSNTKQAIISNVDDDDKLKLEELGGQIAGPLTYNEKNSIFINESGLYSLILKSEKPEAKAFKKWITQEVLPSIRKNGNYNLHQHQQLALELPVYFAKEIEEIKQNNIIKVESESDLQIAIVKYIRHSFPDAVIDASLGELQKTSNDRIKAKMFGYTKGSSDITIRNCNKSFNGLCIEFKTPTGKGILSESQNKYLHEMEILKYKVIISNDYTDLILKIDDYFKDVRLNCAFCNRKFKTKETLNNHLIIFHRTNLYKLKK